MHDIRYPVEIIHDLPVIAAPVEIDATTADQLRVILLQLVAQGHATVVLDTNGTRFCDSSGLSVLVRTHNRALEEGGELRLVIPAGGAVFRVFTLTSLHRFIPRFASLEEALAQRPATASGPSSPRPSPGLGSTADHLGGADEGA